MSETFTFQAEVSQLLKLVINSLYSHKEIFLRELISNASDAIDKLRFRSIREPELTADGTPLEIRLIPDQKAGTLTIEDTGIGMTREELIQNLGTIAHSGSRAFLEKLQSGEKPNLIGQFGVGFYSAYLVADRVDVISRGAGTAHTHRWSSDAHDAFTVEEASRVERGTSIVLHLKEEYKNFLNDWELRELVRRYSDYVSHPILLRVSEGEQAGKFETINKASALWQRSPKDVTQAQYDEFYRHLTHDFDSPLAQTHFQVEGTLLFSGILFFPKKAPVDLFQAQGRRGIHLFVKRVFIMEDCDDLLPPWLRFVRGMIDSEDLPLNVSRELLQDSSIIRTIRKQVIKKSLDRLEEMAKDEPANYAIFWDQFGAVLKEGIATDSDYRDRLADLARFASTHHDELTSLAAYIDRMPEGQKDIYYAIGDSKEAVATSPYLEALRKHGFEVLLLSDPIDEWAIDALPSYKEKKLVSAMRADLKIEDEKGEEQKKQESTVASLCTRIKDILKEKIIEVRPSERLTDSPACLVVPQGAHHAPMEQLLRASGRNFGASRRILEINPSHPLIQNLQHLSEQEPASEQLQDWIETLYDQTVLMEGGRIEDPNRFARRLTSLLQVAAAGASKGSSSPSLA